MPALSRAAHAQELKWLESQIAAREKNDAPLAPEKYRDRIAAYCRDILKVTLTPQQEAIAEALPIHRRVLVPSGNECGKSAMGSCLALYHYDYYRPGLTIVTAPTQAQLTDILFKELRVRSPKKPGWKPRSNRLEDAPDHFITGLVAKGDTPFQGRHEGHVFLMFDEAEGIDDPFWKAGYTMADWWVCFYNPTLTSSPAATAERHQVNGRSSWFTVRMSALDHPNIAAGLRGEPPPIPKAVTLEKVKERLAQWATLIPMDEPEHPDDIVLDGERWRCGPVAQSRILGKRPTTANNSVFSERLWQKMQDTRKQLDDHFPLQIGCDVGRFGEDFTAISIRRGFCVMHTELHNGWSTTQTADRLKHLAVHFANDQEDPKSIPIVIDDTGCGGGVTDQCEDFRFIGVNWGWKAEREDEYPNVRSELWFSLVELVDAGMVDISRLPLDTQNALRDQLLAPLYDLDKRGRRIVEEKQRTKTRLATSSPDLADSLLLALTPSIGHFENHSLLR